MVNGDNTKQQLWVVRLDSWIFSDLLVYLWEFSSTVFTKQLDQYLHSKSSTSIWVDIGKSAILREHDGRFKMQEFSLFLVPLGK